MHGVFWGSFCCLVVRFYLLPGAKSPLNTLYLDSFGAEATEKLSYLAVKMVTVPQNEGLLPSFNNKTGRNPPISSLRVDPVENSEM